MCGSGLSIIVASILCALYADSYTAKIIITLLVAIFSFLITLIIYIKNTIYWYSGLDYDEALKYTDQERKIYAKRIMYRFLIFAIIYIIYSIFALIFKFHWAVTVEVFVVGIIVTAISTAFVKLKKE